MDQTEEVKDQENDAVFSDDHEILILCEDDGEI